MTCVRPAWQRTGSGRGPVCSWLGRARRGPEYSLSDKESFPFGFGVIALKWVYEVVGHDTVVVVVVVDG